MKRLPLIPVLVIVGMLAIVSAQTLPAGVQKAAVKLDRSKQESNCNKCHDVFRD